MSRRLTAFGLGLLAGAVFGLSAWCVVTDWRSAGRVLPGVTVEGVGVGGLTGPEVAARVRERAAATTARPLWVRAGPVEARATASELGMRPAVDRTVAAAMAVGRSGALVDRLFDRTVLLRRPIEVPIQYWYDPAVARQAVERVAASVVVEPKDARVTVTGGRLTVVSPSQDGVVVDLRASVLRVISALVRREAAVDLVIALRRPAFTTEIADRMAEPVARFTTSFPDNPDRVHNIRLAAAALRGVLLPPGALLAYNEIVGPRDPARGYRKAPVLINNVLVPGDGGGVCQVSSTLFNAALLAEMAVETRVNHSRPVPYLAAGLDATVEYGSLDLRLRNTTGQYLYLWTDVTRRSVTVTVYGPRQPGREVAIVVADRVVLPAPTHTVTRRDPKLPTGQIRIEPASPGLRARTLRIVRQDGAVVRQEVVARSYYQPTPRTIFIGAGPAATPASRPATLP
ncbi:MAG: VanW family protein [Armatimonadota bacterium]|nr:VanW family protein [Armatimonadota bacterium]MDR7550127.1 VanW family protein [Armatimonadota bacterium]